MMNVFFQRGSANSAMKSAPLIVSLRHKARLGGLLLAAVLLGGSALANEWLARSGKATEPFNSRPEPEPSTPLDSALTPLVHTFPSFNSRRLDQQIRLYQHYLTQQGPPDVLIVGSSRALQGVDPQVLQEALAARGFRGVRAYNFSINGATARVVNLILQQVLSPNELPRVIVWADGSRAFNSGRPDITYNGIVASEGFRQLRQLQAPLFLSSLAPSPDPQSDANLSTLSTRATPRSVGRPPARPAAEQSRRSELAEGRGSEAQTGLGDRSSITPLVIPALVRQPTPAQIAPDLTPLGFQLVVTRYNPTTYFQQFPRVPGRYDSNYFPWQLTGVQTQATVAIAQFAQQQRLPLIFVSLPLSREHLADSFRRRSEQQFRQQMQQLAAQHGFLFQDLSQRWPTQSHYFADPSHLNREGARAVAQHLATDPALPWSRLLATPFPNQR